MNFRNHAIAGLITGSAATGATYYHSKNIQFSFAMGAVALAGSLAPDIDTGSVPSRIFAWVGILFSCYLIYIKQTRFAAYIGLIYMVLSSGKHRGLTHKWIIPIVCFIGSYLSKQAWPGALAMGWACHLSVDKIPPWKII